MPVAKKKDVPEIEIIKLEKGEFTVWLIGDTPFYCNRMAEKAKRELLMPAGRMTTAQKATRLKHAPVAEYRSSPYLNRRGDGPTRIEMVASAPKKAMATAALDMPTGVARTQINRLVSVPQDKIPMWGRPKLAMDVVRMANAARTPDIRTRARLDRWATCLTIRFVKPLLNETKVATLLAASGMLCGIGDWRQEKGGGSYGLYRITHEDDPELRQIIEEDGLAVQDDALRNPVCANDESEELLDWYLAELNRRGLSVETEQVEDIEVDIIDEAPADMLNALPYNEGEAETQAKLGNGAARNN